MPLEHGRRTRAGRGDGGIGGFYQIVEIVGPQALRAGDVHGVTSMKASSSAAAAHKGRARMIEVHARTFEPIMAPRRPSERTPGQLVRRPLRPPAWAASRSGTGPDRPSPAGDLVVLKGGAGGSQRNLLLVEIGLRRRREHLHVDLGRPHVGEAPLENQPPRGNGR